MELRHLRHFVAVAEELHFGRAAERLHMAQPPLSRSVAQLEALVGARLLDRTSRSVTLTPAGTAFLERARRLLAQAAASVEEAAAIGRGAAGRVQVGFVSSAISLGVPERIQAFRSAYPGVVLDLHEGTTAVTVGRLLGGEVDVGVVRDAEPQDGMDVRAVADEPFVAVLPVGHPRAGARSVAAGALRDEPFVFYPRAAGDFAYRRNLQPCTEAGFAPRIVQEASHWLTVLALVGVGAGVTIAPRSAAAVAPPTVVSVPLRGTDARSEVQLITRAGDDRAVVANFTAAPR